MEDQVSIGTVFVKEGTPLPSSLKLESEPYSNGWRSIKNLNGYELDRRLRAVGWNLFSLAQIKASVVGFNRETAVRRVIERVLAKVTSDNFNALEIGQLDEKRLLGLPYLTVSAHVRHLQESMFLLHDKQLVRRNQARLVASLWDRVG